MTAIAAQRIRTRRRQRRNAIAALHAAAQAAAPTGAALIDVGPLARRVRRLTRIGLALSFLVATPLVISTGSQHGGLAAFGLLLALLWVAMMTNPPYARMAMWLALFACLPTVALAMWALLKGDPSALGATALSLTFSVPFILVALWARQIAHVDVPELGLRRLNVLARPSGGRPGLYASGHYIGTTIYLIVGAFYAALGAIIALILTALTWLLGWVLPIVPNLVGLLGTKLVRPLLFRSSRAARQRRRYSSPDARAVLARDKRAPVLLLRSFVDDELPFEDKGMLDYLYRSDRTFEEVVTDQLWGFGPVVAIGRPGETLPLSGAVREYVPHDAWQQRVEELVGRAAFIVMILGPTPGFGWELQHISRLNSLDKVVLVMPPLPFAEVERRWNTLVTELGLTGAVAQFAEVARVVGALCAVHSAGRLVILRADQRRLYEYGVAIDLAARTARSPGATPGATATGPLTPKPTDAGEFASPTANAGV